MPTRVLSLSSATGKWLCLEFTNTVENYRLSELLDGIPDFGRWVDWSRRHGAITPAQSRRLLAWAAEEPAAAESALQGGHEFRVQLFRLLSARAAGAIPTPAQLEVLNRRLPSCLAHLEISSTNSELEWHWQEVSSPDCLLWPIVRSAAELLTGPQTAQLRQCGGDKCTWLFLDQSKNQSRRWCDMKICGNRAKSRRHYQRQRSPAS